MSLIKSKCWYSNNHSHFLKHAVPLCCSPKNVCKVSGICCYSEFRYDKILFLFSVDMLCVVMLSVVMLNAIAPMDR